MSNISTRVREAHERAKSTITRYRAAVASIDARWTPDNFRPTRYETEQEWQARLAATRASEKVTAEAKFRAEAWRELEGLIGTHRSSVQAAEAQVRREREAFFARHDTAAIDARHAHFREAFEAQSPSLTPDTGARIRAEYARAVAAGDAASIKAIRLAARPFIERIDDLDSSDDTRTMRDLRAEFRRADEQDEAALRGAEAELSAVEGLGGAVGDLVRYAQREAGDQPTSEGDVIRGVWEQRLLGLPAIPEGAIVMPAEAIEPGPEPEPRIPETTTERLERLSGNAGVIGDVGADA